MVKYFHKIMVSRNDKIEELKQYIDKDVIKVVTGFRRSGKSTLFALFIEYLKKSGIKPNCIISINLEDPSFDFESHKDLYKYVLERIDNDNKYYVFLDEIQNIKEFEKAIDGLYLKKNIDLYITGSNANLLSGELATLLSGRYVEIKMMPYSFKEFTEAYDKDIDIRKKFDIYLLNGGMPGNVEFIDDNTSYKYLDGVFSTVVYKDIMQRIKVSDKILMESIIKYLSSIVGSFTNVKNISDYLTSNNYKTTNHTVEKYINAFVESFLFYKADSFDIDGKQILKRNYKYYIVDIGFINYLFGKKANRNYGHILENIVFLELKRRYNEVYVAKIGTQEIDFIVKTNGTEEYYQVAFSTQDEKVLERELKPLQKIDNNYKKILLTLDDLPDTDYDGILRTNIIKWLLDI